MNRLSTAFLTCLMALTVLLGPAASDASAKARPTAVAVVDVQEVFNNLEEKEAIKIDLQKLADTLKQEQEAMGEKLKQMKEDLEFMDKSQQGYEDLVVKIERQQLFFQAFTKYAEAKLELENVRRIELIYNNMRKTIADVARLEGYQIVLFKEVESAEGEVRFPGMGMKEINKAIEGRKVLWSDPSIDLTDRVKTRMNNEYKARPRAN